MRVTQELPWVLLFVCVSVLGGSESGRSAEGTFTLRFDSKSSQTVSEVITD